MAPLNLPLVIAIGKARKNLEFGFAKSRKSFSQISGGPLARIARFEGKLS
jgi:hypothetical protein